MDIDIYEPQEMPQDEAVVWFGEPVTVPIRAGGWVGVKVEPSPPQGHQMSVTDDDLKRAQLQLYNIQIAYYTAMMNALQNKN
jgi:hypothetical protein